MSFLETHDVVISTLSPVHIGCGEDYEPTNYVIEGQTLYAFDPATLLARLPQGQRDELSRTLDAPNPMLAAQRFFWRHRELARDVATHSSPVAELAARYYAARIGQVAQREGDGQNVINKLEIARTAFNPYDGLPLLPGSSLKGAMRTAVLDRLRRERHASFPLSDLDARKTSVASRAARDMESALMEGNFGTDPLRLLKIGDARFQPGSYKARNARGEEVQITRVARNLLFQVNRKKRPNMFASRANIQTLVECVPEGQPRAFLGHIGIEHKAGAAERTPALQPTFRWLAEACNSFYLDRLESELDMLERNGYVTDSWARNARKRLAPEGIWGKRMADRTGFLLRIGRHSGAESVTVDAPRKIKILGAKGTEPTWQREATTVWLASVDPRSQEKMQPFGWVFVQTR